MFYDNKSNTTTVYCYYTLSYVDKTDLDRYLNNRNDDIKITVFQNSINKPIDIRLYYIQIRKAGRESNLYRSF